MLDQVAHAADLGGNNASYELAIDFSVLSTFCGGGTITTTYTGQTGFMICDVSNATVALRINS